MASNNYGSKSTNFLGKGNDAYKERLEDIKKLNDADIKLSREKLRFLQSERMKDQADLLDEETRKRREADKEASDARKRYYEQEGNVIAAAFESAFGTAENTIATIGSLTSELDKVIETYTKNQQSMAAHLVGSANLETVTDTLNQALSTTSLVKQESVYNNLSKLINSGIVYNVEQRAFLQTISDDLDMQFNANNASMNRLIRILNADITSSRVAMEYTLQEYLNQNYETSEYIKDAMSSVSDALTSSQSLMSASDALSYESTIQSWLGSYYSSGISSNTVTGIAKALDQLSSGDISNIGTGLSNLVLMGVARAGLDYGSLMNNNLTSSDVNSIMQGITSYVSSMSGYGNVSKSQLASLFGIDVSDIAAISNLNGVGGASTNINSLFSSYNSLVPATTQISNVLSNFMYSWGTSIASNSTALWSYEIEKMIANNLGDALSSTTMDIGLLGTGVSVNIGQLVKMAPLLTMIPTLIETLGDSVSSLSTGNDMSSIFNLLGSTSTSSGGTIVKISDSGVSGSMYMSNGSTSDIINNAMNSVSSTLSTDTVSGDETSINDLVSAINDSVLNIYDLLDQRLDVKLSELNTYSVANASVFG